MKRPSHGALLNGSLLLMLLTLGPILTGQSNPTLLLNVQRSTANLETDSAAPHARGIGGITFGNPGETSHYPNSLACVLVYGDGRYIFEKTEQSSRGTPKTKIAEASFTPDELKEIRNILNGDVRTVTSLPQPQMPDDAVRVREIETLTVMIDRDGAPQQFMTVKERFQTTNQSGMDSSVDNVGKYGKALTPLQKWFREIEKKSKSELKDATPKHCAPINIGQ